METGTASELDLDTLGSGIPALSTKKAGERLESCIWCLLECNHSNGVLLIVTENETNRPYRIIWKEEGIDREQLLRSYNRDDGLAQGAEAIALLLIRQRTDYTAIRRTAIGPGVDYWLGSKTNANNQLFSYFDARLEVSGILTQSSTNKPLYRVRNKTNQTRRSDDTFIFPAYVIVVEFSKPTASMECRNARY